MIPAVIETPVPERLKPHYQTLLQDDFGDKQARIRIARDLNLARKQLNGNTQQRELEARISVKHKKDSDQFRSSEALRFLPALAQVTSFPFDIKSWVSASVEIGGASVDRTKYALRFLEHWQPHFAKEERTGIFRKLMQCDTENAAFYMALYAGKLKKELADDPSLFEAVLKHCVDHDQVLPLLAQLPYDELPERYRTKEEGTLELFKTNLARWTTLDDEVEVRDDVIPVRHIGHTIGKCADLDWTHNYSLVDNEPVYEDGEWTRIYGDVVLMYLKGELLGSMKMEGSRSILALKTVKDSNGRFPFILGGTYGTTKAITDAAERCYESQGDWPRLDLESIGANRLPVSPRRFIYQEQGFEEVQEYIPKLKEVRARLEARQ